MDKKIGNLLWVLVGFIAIVIAAAVIFSMYSGGGYNGGNYVNNGYYMMGGSGIAMPLIGVVAVVFFLIFLYYMFSASGTHREGQYAPYLNGAEEIAKARLARGEITEGEYQKMVTILRK